MSRSVRLGFAGDVMLGRLVDRAQRRRPVDAVWGDLLGRLRALDGLFVNLECALSTRGEEWTRTHRPFHFRADPSWAVPALERAGVDFTALANNHVLDFGEVALRDTLAHLDGAGISHAGAGTTADAAREPALVSLSALDVGLVSFTDNTPEYAAGPDSPGTAHVEIDVGNDRMRTVVRESLSAVRSINPDLVVASLHWGPNMVTEPPEAFREFGRWLLTAGVDVVHGHSAHVFQGVGVSSGGVICYDCGDFVDDYAVDERLRNDRGFLFELRVEEDGGLQALRLHPIEIDDCSVRNASPEAAAWARDRMRDRSAPFGTAFERDGEQLVVPIG